MANKLTAYQFADLSVVTTMALPELLPATTTAQSWRLAIDPASYPGPRARWFHEWHDGDGQRWMRFGRNRQRYVLRFEQWATFVVDVDRRTITCHADADAPTPTIRHLLLNQVLPLLPGGSRRLVLHASAVRHRGVAIGFVGPGGSGKSTLCAALQRAGCGLITDDALVIERREGVYTVTPSYAAIRLWPDSAGVVHAENAHAAPRSAHYSRKLRFVDARFDPQPVTLGRLCVLATNGATGVHPLPQRQAALALIRSTFLLDIEDATGVTAAFALAADLAASVPVHEMSYVWGLDRLLASTQAILDSVTAA